MEPYGERSEDAPENPFQSPTPMSAPGGPPSDARRPDLPGTVIGVIVCVSLLGMLTLASALINPFGVPVGLAITVTVLIGIVKGRAWGRTMALTLAFIVLGATALFAFGV